MKTVRVASVRSDSGSVRVELDDGSGFDIPFKPTPETLDVIVERELKGLRDRVEKLESELAWLTDRVRELELK